MIKNEKISQLLQEKFATSKRSFNTNFYSKFFELLENNGFSEQDLKSLINNLCTAEEFETFVKNETKDNMIALNNNRAIKNSEKLFDYLNKKFSELGQEKSKEILTKMIEYIAKNKTEGLSYANSMIKYFSLEFANDIKCEYKQENQSESSEINAKLGDFDLAKIIFYLDEDKPELFTFEDLRTITGLQGQRLGAMVLQSLFRMVDENYKGHKVRAFCVIRKNVGAQNFYHRYGGQVYVGENEKMTLEEFRNSDFVHCCMYFFPQDIEKLAKEPDIQPKSFDEINQPKSLI